MDTEQPNPSRQVNQAPCSNRTKHPALPSLSGERKAKEEGGGRIVKFVHGKVEGVSGGG